MFILVLAVLYLNSWFRGSCLVAPDSTKMFKFIDFCVHFLMFEMYIMS